MSHPLRPVPSLLAALILLTMTALPASLKVVTINVWSGLDYRGTFRFGEYETAERREQRFRLLRDGLRRLSPDVVFLQEANPVSSFTERLADALGYEHLHQVCMGGIKFGPLGIPSNFKEGIAILARPGLGLRRAGIWKLSGGAGLHGDVMTFQFTEACFALAASLTVEGKTLYVVNTHLHSVPQMDSSLHRRLEEDLRAGSISRQEFDDAVAAWREGLDLQAAQLGELQKRLGGLPPEVPVILGGDFNMPPDRDTLAGFRAQNGFSDACGTAELREATWDPARNENVGYSMRLTDISGSPLAALDRLDAYANSAPSHIDHILLSRHFGPTAVRMAAVVLDSSDDAGIHASDHYGVMAEVDPQDALAQLPADLRGEESTTEPLPILSYDTDTGFGYGLKLFALNHLGARESFDLVLFNSTRGERWYRFVFSLPDFEMRQGTTYPLALDLTVDYDKWIKNSFFGIGNTSSFEDREYYTRQPLEITLTAGRGVSPVFVVQAGVKYLTVQNSGYADTSALLELTPTTSAGRATASSVLGSIRFDTRNSYVNPTHGVVLEADVELAPKFSWTNVRYARAGAVVQYYTELFYPTTVFAARLWFQGLFGDDIPVQMLLPIGGTRTLRGYVQDRFLDMVSGVANVEVRFPIVWRFGGVVGYDLGKVWHRPGELDLKRWAVNPVAGLRFVFETFIVRLDLGFGPETTGFYLNFGHLF
jgi:endonuclease/exonuclease/phosphatase family metal-dependent hydrolase